MKYERKPVYRVPAVGGWTWRKGDRAKVCALTREGKGADQIGLVFEVKRVSNFFRTPLLIWREETWKTRQGHFAYRCKPVIRVPAIMRPMPKYEDLP